MNSNQQDAILVLGGTGKTGRRVAERLDRTGPARPHRLALRRAAVRLGRPLDLGARLCDGIGPAYISYYPDLAIPGAAETLGSFAELAVESGVPRLVLLSGRGEAEADARPSRPCATPAPS